MTFTDQSHAPSSSPVQTRTASPVSGIGNARVLLVDDDPDFIEILSENLTRVGLTATADINSVSARDRLLAGQAYDLILLDWYMPELPGIAFLRAIRDAGIETPVIVLSGVGKDEIEDAALGCGAVDFIDKTRRFSVLLKRIKIAIEHAGPGETAAADSADLLRVGELTLSPRHCRARWRGEEVELTVTAFNIVKLLAASPGVDFTYREIYDVVHREGFFAGDGEDGIRVNVRSLIRRIRMKFREIDEKFTSIENYPAFGYRWRKPADNGSRSAGRTGPSGIAALPPAPPAP